MAGSVGTIERSLCRSSNSMAKGVESVQAAILWRRNNGITGGPSKLISARIAGVI